MTDAQNATRAWPAAAEEELAVSAVTECHLSEEGVSPSLATHGGCQPAARGGHAPARCQALAQRGRHRLTPRTRSAQVLAPSASPCRFLFVSKRSFGATSSRKPSGAAPPRERLSSCAHCRRCITSPSRSLQLCTWPTPHPRDTGGDVPVGLWVPGPGT